MAPMFSAANSAYSADTARARPGFAFGPGSITNGEVRVRFARKAKSSAQLRSPHVVRVFDYGESDGALYLAMEWLEGEDLSTRLDRSEVFDPASTYRIIVHVPRALMGAHAMGIVHRNLKPENVFFVRSYDEEIAKVMMIGPFAQSAAHRSRSCRPPNVRALFVANGRPDVALISSVDQSTLAAMACALGLRHRCRVVRRRWLRFSSLTWDQVRLGTSRAGPLARKSQK